MQTIMTAKSKKRSAFLLFVAVALISITTMSGFKSLSSSAQMVTLTPIIVNTLDIVFPSPSPSPIFSPTRPSTSTAMPSTPTPIFTSTNTFTPAPTYTASPTLQISLTHNPNIKFPKNLNLDEWIPSKDSNFYYQIAQIEEKYRNSDNYDIFPSPLVGGPLFYDDKNTQVYYSKVMLNGHELIAKGEHQKSHSVISVFYNGNEISRIDTGSGNYYARPSIWGLWTYQDQWIMEYVSSFYDPFGRQYNLGNIIWNGESLNHKFKYQESFGVTGIDGRILYFFRRNNQIGISYDGTEYNLGYESVDHYSCCGIGMFVNPQRLGLLDQDLRFFAKRNGKRYFVVISAK